MYNKSYVNKLLVKNNNNLCCWFRNMVLNPALLTSLGDVGTPCTFPVLSHGVCARVCSAFESWQRVVVCADCRREAWAKATRVLRTRTRKSRYTTRVSTKTYTKHSMYDTRFPWVHTRNLFLCRMCFREHIHRDFLSDTRLCEYAHRPRNRTLHGMRLYQSMYVHKVP